MKIKGLILFVAVFYCVNLQAQTPVNSTLYADYNINKTTSILPDFSYVGYHNGNDSIPTVNHTVFNVTNYGAIADDNLSDRAAIEAAIAAARANGSGIVFFPPGRFRINEVGDSDTQSILINGSNIVFRGSGSGPGGTELFMSRTMQPTNPSQMWTTVKMFSTTASGSNALAGTVTTAANIGDFNITLTSKGALVAGDKGKSTKNQSLSGSHQTDAGAVVLTVVDVTITKANVPRTVTIACIGRRRPENTARGVWKGNDIDFGIVIFTAIAEAICISNILTIGAYRRLTPCRALHQSIQLIDSGYSPVAVASIAKTLRGFQCLIPRHFHGQTCTGAACPLLSKAATHPGKVGFGIGNGAIAVITIAPINKGFSWGAGRLGGSIISILGLACLSDRFYGGIMGNALQFFG